MNEQTATLVTQLAAKLGTTSEYLWAVLLKQAPVQGWIMAVEYIVTFAVIYAVWKWRDSLSAAIKWCFEEGEGSAILCFIGLGIVGIASTVWLIACMFGITDIITAFVNPEYWALKQVLAAVKPK